MLFLDSLFPIFRLIPLFAFLDHPFHVQNMGKENKVQIGRRWQKQKKYDASRKNKQERKELMRKYVSRKRSVEKEETRQKRLEIMRERNKKNLKSETDKAREKHLENMCERFSEHHKSESNNERKKRLEAKREQIKLKRREQYQSAEEFKKDINQVANRICEICHKQCYANQVTNYQLLKRKIPDFIPLDLISNKTILVLCHRCNSKMTSKKPTMPPRAYWNDLQLEDIPVEISRLNEVERRLLSRITPFMRIIKLNGSFGQYALRGQSIHFALDIFEVAPKLNEWLPFSPEDAAISIIVEEMLDLNKVHQFKIRQNYVKDALNWLLANNPLYNDVKNNFENVDFDIQKVVKVIPKENDEDKHKRDNDVNAEFRKNRSKKVGAETKSAYLFAAQGRQIIHASCHQGNVRFAENAGVQCVAMALMTNIFQHLLPPEQWNTSRYDLMMLYADRIYTEIKSRCKISNNPVAASGYLQMSNLKVIRYDFICFEDHTDLENSFALEFEI